MRGGGRPLDERGQVSLLIIGFAVVLLSFAVVVVNSSAAYLQRQGLDSVADGAALQGADLGSVGLLGGIGQEQRLVQSHGEVDAAVREHLRSTGAYDRFPGLRYDVRVDERAGSVTVTVRAPLDLPLTLPGLAWDAPVSATGRAAVYVEP